MISVWKWCDSGRNSDDDGMIHLKLRLSLMRYKFPEIR